MRGVTGILTKNADGTPKQVFFEPYRGLLTSTVKLFTPLKLYAVIGDRNNDYNGVYIEDNKGDKQFVVTRTYLKCPNLGDTSRWIVARQRKETI